MANIFPIGISHIPAVGTPTVILGTLTITVSSISHSPAIGTPAIANINLQGQGIPADQQGVGIPQLYSVSAANESWTQVETQLPEFIRDDHPEFIKFIQEFFRWRERKEGPLYMLRRLFSLQDINTTSIELMEFFFREYAPTFPRSTVLSPSVIIKNIRQFYLAKGTEKSFKFLFRVFFGQDIEFYYPRLDILRFSDGKWIQDRTIKCILESGDPSLIIGNRIIGTTTKASAFVEKVLLVQDGNITTYELFLNRSSITGKFQANEILASEDGSITLRLLPIVVKIRINQGGLGYQAGQEVIINGDGFNCKARINTVTNVGAVKTVQIYQFGSGYSPLTTTVTFPLYPGVTSLAYGTPIFDTITKYPGYFLNSDGQFSSLKAIQDGNYYSQWSYVIKSEQSRDKYESIVKSLVHPAGFIMFSEVNSETVIDGGAELPVDDNGESNLEVDIFTDLQNDYNEFNIVEPQELFFVDAGAELEESSIELSQEDSDYDIESEQLGPTWRAWNVWKTDYRPTPVFGLPNDEVVDPPGYFDLYANTPLKAFANEKLSDIRYKEYLAIDHLPETQISQEEEP